MLGLGIYLGFGFLVACLILVAICFDFVYLRSGFDGLLVLWVGSFLFVFWFWVIFWFWCLSGVWCFQVGCFMFACEFLIW